MGSNKDKLIQTKFNGDENAYREHMRRLAKKAGLASAASGNQRRFSSEQARKAANIRWSKENKKGIK